MDIRTNEPFNILESFQREFVEVQITMDNAFCPFKFSASMVAGDARISEAHKNVYICSSLVLALYHCVVIFLLCDTFRTKLNQAEKVPVHSFMALAAMDFYFLIINAVTFVEPVAIDIIFSLVNLFHCINMQKVIWVIANIQIGDMNPRLIRFKVLWNMNKWSCVLVVMPAALSLLLNSNIIFYFTFLVFGLPQIIKNFKDSRKYRVELWPLAGLLLPKLLFTAYMKINKDNVFRYSPDPNVFWICLYLLIIQAIILMIQMRWPRFGFEGKPTYFFFEPGSLDLLQDVCSICLEQCRIEIKLTQSLKQKMVRTLCNHEFHYDCLLSWMKSKLECPYCRQVLSPIPDPDDQS